MSVTWYWFATAILLGLALIGLIANTVAHLHSEAADDRQPRVWGGGHVEVTEAPVDWTERGWA